MPALRQSVKRRRLWIFLAVAAVLGAAAISDWLKPAYDQRSVRLYNQAVTRIYREHIHPVTSRFVRCRFQPNCSDYSVIAVQVHGFPKGMWLTVKRLCRCLPWVRPGTWDPVPPPKAPAAVAQTVH
jgi:uncharacterized protein